MIHGIITLILVGLAALFNVAVPVAFFVVAFFIGREHAQAEERVIKDFYNKKRANMPLYGGLELRAWNIKSVLDFILPAIVAVLIVNHVLIINYVGSLLNG